MILEHFVRTGEQHPGLVKALGGEIRVGSLEDLLLKEDAKALAAAALTDGDAERGEAIFRRKSLACLSCHGIMNAGSRIGPDLGTIGSGAQPDYLVDSFLRPSKVIKEVFETVVILTTDGRLVNGILVSSNDDEVVIRDPQRQGEEASIARSRIDAMRKGKSLMPTGLANKLKNRQEFLDLVKFITQLGRPGPYATSVEPVIRRWRVLPTASFDSIGPAEQIRVTVKNGSPAYSRVDGRLPMGELPPEFQEFLLVAEIDVQQGGAVRLSIEGVKPTGIYFDGGELKQAADMTVRPGRHTIGILIRDFDAGASLRAKLTAVDGTAQFRIVGGR